MRQYIDLVSGNIKPSTPSGNLLRTLEEGMKDNLKMLAGLYQLAEKYHLPAMRADIDELEQLMRQLKRSDRQVWTARYGRIDIATKWYEINISVFRDSPILKKVMDDLEKHLEYRLQDAIASGDEEEYAMAQRDIEQEVSVASVSELRRIYVAFQEEVGLLLEKYKTDFRKTIGEDYKILAGFGSDTSYVSQIRRIILNHFLHINYSKIQNYTFRNVSFTKIYDDLTNLETEYKEKVSGLLVMYEGDEIIKKVGEYVWVMLDRGYCRAEADAMGHCGNAGAASGDRILSLRKFEERVDGEDYYSVYLTFILDRDGRLGEMKGRANEKPAEKYHPYIIELLKMPLIKGLKGGGYMPQNNFSINDLTEDQQNALFDVRPELAGFTYRLNKIGDSEELRAAIIQKIKDMDTYRGDYGPFKNLKFEEDNLVFMTFKDIENLVDELSDDDLSKKIASNENVFDSWDFEVDDNELAELLDKLETQRLVKVAEYVDNLVKENEDEDEYEDFDMTSTSEIVSKLEEHDEDNYDVLKNAVRDGRSSGAEGDAIDALRKSILSAQQSIEHGTLDLPGTEDGRFNWDSEVKILIPIKKLVGILDAIDTMDEDEEQHLVHNWAEFFWPEEEGKPIKAEEPYYGFSGYDEDYAFQRMEDEFVIDGETLSSIEIEKADKPDFSNMPLDEVKKWISDTYEKVPDGFIRKVSLETVDEWRIPQIAAGLYTAYYGKK